MGLPEKPLYAKAVFFQAAFLGECERTIFQEKESPARFFSFSNSSDHRDETVFAAISIKGPK